MCTFYDKQIRPYVFLVFYWDRPRDPILSIKTCLKASWAVGGEGLTQEATPGHRSWHVPSGKASLCPELAYFIQRITDWPFPTDTRASRVGKAVAQSRVALYPICSPLSPEDITNRKLGRHGLYPKSHMTENEDPRCGRNHLFSEYTSGHETLNLFLFFTLDWLIGWLIDLYF